MCLTIKSLKFLKELNNGVYDNLRVEMLFDSNKLEGYLKNQQKRYISDLKKELNE